MAEVLSCDTCDMVVWWMSRCGCCCHSTGWSAKVISSDYFESPRSALVQGGASILKKGRGDSHSAYAIYQARYVAGLIWRAYDALRRRRVGFHSFQRTSPDGQGTEADPVVWYRCISCTEKEELFVRRALVFPAGEPDQRTKSAPRNNSTYSPSMSGLTYEAGGATMWLGVMFCHHLGAV
jgi:hypothetical protein